jgi:hypothetical protein
MAHWDLLSPAVRTGRFVAVGCKAWRLLRDVSAGCFPVPREHCISHPAKWRLSDSASTLDDGEVLDQKKYNADTLTIAQTQLRRLGVPLPLEALAAAARFSGRKEKRPRGVLMPGQWSCGVAQEPSPAKKISRMTVLPAVPEVPTREPAARLPVASVGFMSSARSFADVLREFESDDL